MKKTSVTLLCTLFAASLFLASCSPFSKVYSEEEPGVNLAQYHTFDWLDNTDVDQGNAGPEWISENTQHMIRSAVAAQMGRYGFKPCDEKPDLILHYHIVIKNEVLYAHDWSCIGQQDSPVQYDRCHRIQPIHYQEGTFIVDFIDAKNGHQVWRGAAVGILENLRPEEADARIKKAVEAIFKKYPEKPIPSVIQ